MQRQPPIFKRTVIVGPDTKLFRSVEVLRCGALDEEHVAPPELARDGALRNLLQSSVVELGEELGATDEIDVDHADVDSSGASVTIFTGSTLGGDADLNLDRKYVVKGKSGSVRVDLGGTRNI